MSTQMTVEFGLLGDVRASIDGQPVDLGHARQRCVLAALLVDANQPVPVDRLIDRVWADRPPQRARATVYSYVSRLRQILSDAPGVDVVRQPGGYVLTGDPQAVDLHRFRRLVAAAGQAEDERQAADLLDQALGLWRGEAFGQLDTPWLGEVRESLHQQRLAAQLDRADLALAHGRHAELLGDLAVSFAAYELDERLAGQLMLARYRSGQQAAALEVYEELRRRLADELGADPSPTLQVLYQQILRADPALAVRPRSTTTGRGTRASVPRQLPALPGVFTGRTRELDLLSATLASDAGPAGTVVISAIGGAGGIGKTWLALRWANDHLERFPDGQLYVNLHGFDPGSEPVAPAIALRGFLDALGVEPGRIPIDLDARAGLYRSLVANRRMLIVLDNARSTEQVSSMLPGTPTCTVLVTSRRDLPGLATAHGARPLALDVLPDDEAYNLLVRHLGRPRLEAEPEPVAAVLRSCAGLPLALGIVAARAARQPHIPIAALADELSEASTRLDALDAGELAANLRGVLSCSYDALPAEASMVFALLGLAPGPDIGLPATVSLTGLPTVRARSAFRELLSAHLVQEHEPSRYRMHDLVRLYATEIAHAVVSGDDRHAALHRVLDHYLQTANAGALVISPSRRPIALVEPCGPVVAEPLTDQERAHTWFSAEHAVLLAAVDRALEHRLDQHAWQLAWSLAPFHGRGGHGREDAVVQRAGLGAAERLADPRAQALCQLGLSMAHGALGAYEESHADLERALELFDEVGDADGLAHTHLQLAQLQVWLDRPQDGLAQCAQALALYRAAEDPYGEANALNGIGWLHVLLGTFDEAVDYCQQALRLHQRIGHRHGEANTWDSLGYAQHHLGHYDEALASYERALDLYRDDRDRAHEALALTHIGDTYDSSANPERARTAWADALTILEAIGHRDAELVRDKLAAAH